MINPRGEQEHIAVTPITHHRSINNQQSFGVTLDVGLCPCTRNGKLQPLAINGNSVLLCCPSRECSNKIIKIKWDE